MVEHESFKATIDGSGQPLTARTPISEECVLQGVNQNPHTRERAIAV